MSEKILFDKTELIYSDMSSGREVMRNITYDKITSILIGKRQLKKLFGLIKTVTPCILITVNGISYPLEVRQSEEGEELFNKYVEQIRKFAHDNHVTIRDAGENDVPYGAKEDWRLTRGSVN